MRVFNKSNECNAVHYTDKDVEEPDLHKTQLKQAIMEHLLRALKWGSEGASSCLQLCIQRWPNESFQQFLFLFAQLSFPSGQKVHT